MAFVVAVAAAVWGAISAAAAAVVSVISTVVSAVASVVSTVVGWVGTAYAAVSGFIEGIVGLTLGEVFTVVSTVYSVYQVVAAFCRGDTEAGIAGIAGVVGNIYHVIGDNIQGFVGDLAEGFGQFIETIHLKEIINISNIAYLVSDDYRETMSQVYTEIGNVSKTLGNSPEFMNVLLRDAKLSVLSTASLMGRKYDVGELGWIKTLQDFLKVFSADANSYYNNPGKLIQDIDANIIKPAYDAQGTVFQNLYGIIETTLAASEKVLETTAETDNRLTEFIGTLPDDVQKYVTPYINQVRDEYTRIVDTEVTPRLRTLEVVVNRLENNQMLNLEQMQAAMTIMKDPSQYLTLIETLSDDKRSYCEDYLADVSSRSYRRTAKDFASHTADYIDRLNKIKQALTLELKKPAWDVGELEEPARPPDTPVEPRKTWNVGDY